MDGCKGPDYSYFAVDTSEKLGKGASASVYKAYEIKQNGDYDKRKIYAVKVIGKGYVNTNINEDKMKYKQEAGIQRNYYHFRGAVLIPNEGIYSISEYLPGNNLLENCGKGMTHYSKLEPLTFYQRVNLAAQLVTSTNLYHHTTPTTGNAIVHSDIKAENVNVNIKKMDPQKSILMILACHLI